MPAFSHKVRALALVVPLAVIFAVLLGKSALFERIENVLWDWRARLAARPSRADAEIKLIVIDQGSLDYFDQEQSITWPWPRPIYIPVIQFLERAGARAAAFDILFTESSQSGVEDDRQFADALASKLPVVMAASFNATSRAVEAGKKAAFEEKQLAANQTTQFSRRYLQHAGISRFSSATLPLLDLMRSSSALGIVNAAPDEDGIFRRYKPGAFLEEVPALGLPFALFEAGRGAEDPEPKLSSFLDEDGRMTLKLHGPSNTYRTYNIVSIIRSELALQEGREPEIDPKEFAGAWVLIGVWAPGLLDLRPTSLDRVYRGVEFNATVLDNLLHGDFVRRTPLYLNLAVLIIFAALACALIELTTAAVWQALFFLLVTTGLLLFGWGLALAGYWLPLAAPLLGIVTSALGTSLYRYQIEGKERRFLKSAFAQYVSPAVIEQLIQNPALLALGGERRELTMFFSDIEGFTAIAEKLPADKLVQLSNALLSAMTKVILQENGTLDKYIGDAIVAFWNAPLPVQDHACRAVRAALRCQEEIQEMQPVFEREFGCEIKVRIGIHTGHVTVGNIGSKERFNYTMLGDAANLASRLEGANKYFGSYVLISEKTKEALDGQIEVRELGLVRVLGKQEVQRVYEPLTAGRSAEAQRAASEFARARELFEKGDLQGARARFAALADDSVAVKYLERIDRELAAGPGGFSAVWSLGGK